MNQNNIKLLRRVEESKKPNHLKHLEIKRALGQDKNMVNNQMEIR